MDETIDIEQLTGQNLKDYYHSFINEKWKSGDAILAELTPHDCEFLHAGVGIAGESSGELLLAWEEHLFAPYKPAKHINIETCGWDKQNMLEELSDMEFFMERNYILSGIQERFDSELEKKYKKEGLEFMFNKPLEVCVMITNRCGQILDWIKKRVLYRKENLPTEDVDRWLAEIQFLMGKLRDIFGFTREEVIRHNIYKLSKRYKGKFSNQDASLRADKIVD